MCHEYASAEAFEREWERELEESLESVDEAGDDSDELELAERTVPAADD